MPQGAGQLVVHDAKLGHIRLAGGLVQILFQGGQQGLLFRPQGGLQAAELLLPEGDGAGAPGVEKPPLGGGQLGNRHRHPSFLSSA